MSIEFHNITASRCYYEPKAYIMMGLINKKAGNRTGPSGPTIRPGAGECPGNMKVEEQWYLGNVRHRVADV